MSYYGENIPKLADGIERGLKAIATALSERPPTYNVIVNVPATVDVEEIATHVAEAMDRVKTRRNADDARLGPM